jgi:hypothetical protein
MIDSTVGNPELRNYFVSDKVFAFVLVEKVSI